MMLQLSTKAIRRVPNNAIRLLLANSHASNLAPCSLVYRAFNACPPIWIIQ
jgi:hypothetical protein